MHAFHSSKFDRIYCSVVGVVSLPVFFSTDTAVHVEQIQSRTSDHQARASEHRLNKPPKRAQNANLIKAKVLNAKRHEAWKQSKVTGNINVEVTLYAYPVGGAAQKVQMGSIIMCFKETEDADSVLDILLAQMYTQYTRSPVKKLGPPPVFECGRVEFSLVRANQANTIIDESQIMSKNLSIGQLRDGFNTDGILTNKDNRQGLLSLRLTVWTPDDSENSDSDENGKTSANSQSHAHDLQQ
ncbi:hypothetical protein K439DRAFT_1615213 [Ramaria rubella]|nr:hypothetical protein K439DRAFT_1615213 [Ramaria rubella]